MAGVYTLCRDNTAGTPSLLTVDDFLEDPGLITNLPRLVRELDTFGIPYFIRIAAYYGNELTQTCTSRVLLVNCSDPDLQRLHAIICEHCLGTLNLAVPYGFGPNNVPFWVYFTPDSNDGDDGKEEPLPAPPPVDRIPVLA